MVDAGELLAVGTAAPAFTLASTAGELSLAALLEEGPVALFFYPGNDTPG